MVAPPLAVDREQIRMLVLAVGCTEAAKQTGISLNTILSWSARGKWLKPAQPQLPPTVKPRAIHAIKPADALQNAIEEDSQACKTYALKYAKRTLKHAASKADADPDSALAQASDVQAVTRTAALAGSWSAATQDVRINVFSDGGQIVDVESLPSAGDER